MYISKYLEDNCRNLGCKKLVEIIGGSYKFEPVQLLKASNVPLNPDLIYISTDPTSKKT